MLGVMFISGNGVPEDLNLGLHWLGRAAEGGDSYSEMILALIFADIPHPSPESAEAKYFMAMQREMGLGKPKGDKTSRELKMEAAQQGFAPARASLKSIEWLRQATAHGHSLAQFHIAIGFDPGDYEKSAAWYLKAANLGNI